MRSLPSQDGGCGQPLRFGSKAVSPEICEISSTLNGKTLSRSFALQRVFLRRSENGAIPWEVQRLMPSPLHTHAVKCTQCRGSWLFLRKLAGIKTCVNCGQQWHRTEYCGMWYFNPTLHISISSMTVALKYLVPIYRYSNLRLKYDYISTRTLKGGLVGTASGISVLHLRAPCALSTVCFGASLGLPGDPKTRVLPSGEGVIYPEPQTLNPKPIAHYIVGFRVPGRVYATPKPRSVQAF